MRNPKGDARLALYSFSGVIHRRSRSVLSCSATSGVFTQARAVLGFMAQPFCNLDSDQQDNSKAVNWMSRDMDAHRKPSTRPS